MPSLFPPVPQPDDAVPVEPAPDTYTGPMVQEPQVWWSVCARCGERYAVPPDQSSAPHVCADMKSEVMSVALRSERDQARALLDWLVHDLDRTPGLPEEVAAIIGTVKQRRTWA